MDNLNKVENVEVSRSVDSPLVGAMVIGETLIGEFIPAAVAMGVSYLTNGNPNVREVFTNPELGFACATLGLVGFCSGLYHADRYESRCLARGIQR